ncbi:MAG TPA: ankyrin repeat domain-containing protein [Gemmatimonadales bacterium]|nr:ankyrin repeat domain-containing protein [Gemmatimonadales bacterium]
MAAVLGDAAAVIGLLADDPPGATRPSAPYGWDPLTCLCFSRYLRIERHRTGDFVEAATVLLDAGADPRAGWYEEAHQPSPVWESALYGAAGVAHSPELTRLLLERGADPNDEETPYHAPEGWDTATVRVLAESGRLTPDSFATMLLRSADWHHLDGVRLLLDHGADPNRMTRWGRTALQQAVLRDNDLAIVEAMLDHGADPTRPTGGPTAVALAADRGRGDILALLEHPGIPAPLDGLRAVAAASALGRLQQGRQLLDSNPALRLQLDVHGGELLAAFAGNDNAAGLAVLFELGVEPGTRLAAGDGYWGIAPGSTALHAAAWRAAHAAVELLVGRGVAVDAMDGLGRTALELAIRAGTDSYWSHRRSISSIRTLLAAGATADRFSRPTGWPEADELLSASAE